MRPCSPLARRHSVNMPAADTAAVGAAATPRWVAVAAEATAGALAVGLAELAEADLVVVLVAGLMPGALVAADSVALVPEGALAAPDSVVLVPEAVLLGAAAASAVAIAPAARRVSLGTAP